MNTSTISSLRLKHVFLVSLGGMLELFDFTIYALLATYLGLVFFPAGNSNVAMLHAFLVFALGYFARPIGGILFSHFGDRYGRKNAFQSSIFIMALSTLLLALLPTYQQIGIFSPILLIFIRLLQGMSLGGEIPGSAVFTFEHFKKIPGLALGIIFMSLTLGNVLAILLIVILKAVLNEAQMLVYGWRLAFILGSFIGIVGFILRRKITETPDFSVYKNWLSQQKERPIPVLELFKHGFRPMLSCIGLTSLSVSGIFLVLSLPIYLSGLASTFVD